MNTSTTSLEPRRYRRRIFGQLWTLAVQFALGMVLNLVGSEAVGGMHGIYIAALILHIVTAIGLIEGAIYIIFKAPSRLNWLTLGVLALTFVSGLLTVWTGQDAWSLVMAAGFGLTGWLYGMAYVRADRVLR